MKIAPFATEHFFAQYEFNTPYQLCNSDCETVHAHMIHFPNYYRNANAYQYAYTDYYTYLKSDEYFRSLYSTNENANCNEGYWRW